MINPNSPIYRKAFEQYLRRGTSIEAFLKAATAAEDARTTRYYVWRTMGDNRVRPSHQANEGQIFAWDDPSATGNPGDGFGCRCWAEPYTPEPGLDGVYPELLFLPGGFIVRRIGGEIIRRVLRRNETAPATLEPHDILAPNGQPIGKPGMRPEVRIESGGDKAAKALFDQLSKGGRPDTPKGYPGTGTRLSNGDWVGYRPQAKSGSPTIDIDVKDIGFDKIHFY